MLYALSVVNKAIAKLIATTTCQKARDLTDFGLLKKMSLNIPPSDLPTTP